MGFKRFVTDRFLEPQIEAPALALCPTTARASCRKMSPLSRSGRCLLDPFGVSSIRSNRDLVQ